MEQITRTTPFRCTILHFAQIFLTDARTFIISSACSFLQLSAHSFQLSAANAERLWLIAVS